MPQIQWEKSEGNCQMAAVFAPKVGRYSTGRARNCVVTLMINHTDKGWLWSAAVLGPKVHRAGVENSLEAAIETVIAALPDIWSELRDYTIGDLRQGEDVPPMEPSWN